MKRFIFTILVILSGITSFVSFLMILNFPPFDLDTATWGLKIIWLLFSIAIMIGLQALFSFILREFE